MERYINVQNNRQQKNQLLGSTVARTLGKVKATPRALRPATPKAKTPTVFKARHSEYR